mmetsp:Transcript_26665/g.78481  ORF Transcript_26665/g.78481 Transcript_26665/m.78481 type:complete len:314 (+) Transcript_26665:1430-2371(+)
MPVHHAAARVGLGEEPVRGRVRRGVPLLHVLAVLVDPHEQDAQWLEHLGAGRALERRDGGDERGLREVLVLEHEGEVHDEELLAAHHLRRRLAVGQLGRGAAGAPGAQVGAQAPRHLRGHLHRIRPDALEDLRRELRVGLPGLGGGPRGPQEGRRHGRELPGERHLLCVGPGFLHARVLAVGAKEVGGKLGDARLHRGEGEIEGLLHAKVLVDGDVVLEAGGEAEERHVVGGGLAKPAGAGEHRVRVGRPRLVGEARRPGVLLPLVVLAVDDQVRGARGALPVRALLGQLGRGLEDGCGVLVDAQLVESRQVP